MRHSKSKRGSLKSNRTWPGALPGQVKAKEEYKMTKNPWNTGSDAQKYWMRKWKHEQEVCDVCAKQLCRKCTVVDRQNKNICQLLRERS